MSDGGKNCFKFEVISHKVLCDTASIACRCVCVCYVLKIFTCSFYLNVSCTLQTLYAMFKNMLGYSTEELVTIGMSMSHGQKVYTYPNRKVRNNDIHRY